MQNFWDKLEPKERWIIVGLYALSLLLAGVVGYGWGRRSEPPTHHIEIAVNHPDAPTEPNLPYVETVDLTESTPEPSGNDSTPSDTSAEPNPEPLSSLVVHVSGAVLNSGVYRLAEGSRVADAIEQAGGATSNADLDALNLAEVLTDGQKVYVPRKGEMPPPAVITSAGSGSSARIPSSGRVSTPASSAPRFPIDLNRASAKELEALPGIGEVIAQRIVEYRQRNGPFRSVDELMNVRGIGPKKMESIRPLVTVR